MFEVNEPNSPNLVKNHQNYYITPTVPLAVAPKFQAVRLKTDRSYNNCDHQQFIAPYNPSPLPPKI